MNKYEFKIEADDETPDFKLTWLILRFPDNKIRYSILMQNNLTDFGVKQLQRELLCSARDDGLLESWKDGDIPDMYSKYISVPYVKGCSIRYER